MNTYFGNKVAIIIHQRIQTNHRYWVTDYADDWQLGY